MEGYRALETRARQALPAWTATLSPPAATAPPAVPIDAGVIGSAALDAAAWGSARLGRALRIEGGSTAQRRAVSAGITERGGSAEAGRPGGALRLTWTPQGDDA
ncbi:hypothetical protein GCM10011380_33490 [Sphingomonas metalli]|uniref:Uncharacterized protein n=1 Tax=Sphingomonas metalli TaxID=1779358 RepID=A0A916TES2_9SPHN|nr:hypothetical protein [Sphingomonas metalli]GGB41302.1 hypothetical protein GCM10011380_33490 [Sphingomonas metalli]